MIPRPLEPEAKAALLRRYALEFEELNHGLAIHSGFVLIPVFCPALEVAQALQAHLQAEGYSVELLAPEGPHWSAAIEALLAPVESGETIPVRMVFGREAASRWLEAGLRSLNQRRDLLPLRHPGPLLWCGTASFLEVCWGAMPDLWSIRALAFHLPDVPDVPAESELSAVPLPASASQPPLVLPAAMPLDVACEEKPAGGAAEGRLEHGEEARQGDNPPPKLQIPSWSFLLPEPEEEETPLSLAEEARAHLQTGEVQLRKHYRSEAQRHFRRVETLAQELDDDSLKKEAEGYLSLLDADDSETGEQEVARDVSGLLELPAEPHPGGPGRPGLPPASAPGMASPFTPQPVFSPSPLTQAPPQPPSPVPAPPPALEGGRRERAGEKPAASEKSSTAAPQKKGVIREEDPPVWQPFGDKTNMRKSAGSGALPEREGPSSASSTESPGFWQRLLGTLGAVGRGGGETEARREQSSVEASPEFSGSAGRRRNGLPSGEREVLEGLLDQELESHQREWLAANLGIELPLLKLKRGLSGARLLDEVERVGKLDALLVELELHYPQNQALRRFLRRLAGVDGPAKLR